MSRIDRYKCDGCGKEATSGPTGNQPEGWANGWFAGDTFHGCSPLCLAKAGRAACDKLMAPKPLPPPTEDSPGPRRG